MRKRKHGSPIRSAAAAAAPHDRRQVLDQSAGLHAGLLEAGHRAADDAAAEKDVEEAEDRRARFSAQALGDLERIVGLAGDVHQDRDVEHDRAGRRARDGGQDVVQGPVAQVAELDTALPLLEIAEGLGLVHLVSRMHVAHHVDAAGIGQEAERRGQRAAQVEGEGMADDRAVRLRQGQPGRQVEGEHRRVREEGAALGEDELQRLRIERDDQIDLSVPVAVRHQFGQVAPMLRAGIPRQVQMLEELVLDAQAARFQGRHEALAGHDVDRHVGLEGVEDQDVLTFGRDGTRREDEREEEGQPGYGKESSAPRQHPVPETGIVRFQRPLRQGPARGRLADGARWWYACAGAISDLHERTRR